jgi:hypothetical protein
MRAKASEKLGHTDLPLVLIPRQCWVKEERLGNKDLGLGMRAEGMKHCSYPNPPASFYEAPLFLQRKWAKKSEIRITASRSQVISGMGGSLL